MRRFALLAAFFCWPLVGAFAQTAPVGYIEYSFAATGTAATYYMSAPLLNSIIFSGTLTAAGGNALTVGTANWTVNEFTESGTGAPCFAFLTSGAEAGRFLPIISNTATQLVVDVTDNSTQSTPLNTSGFAVSGTEGLIISTGLSIGNFFGNSAGSAFPGSGTSFAATGGVGLWNSQTLAFDHYYYNTTVSHWVKDGASTAADAGPTVIPPSATIAIYLPAGYAGGVLVNAGSPVTVAPRLKVPGSNVVRYFGMFVPVDMTLSQVNLGSNWAAGNTPFTADTLSVYNSTLGKWNAYYETPGGNWLMSGSTASQNSTVIPAGSAVAFLKRAAVSGSNSLLPIALPYPP